MELSKAGQERLDRLIERKYMSTKTVTKRIALATVVALGAGVLSLVSVTSANALPNSAVGTAGPLAASNVLNISTVNSSTGAITTPTDAHIPADGDGTSAGLLAVSDIAGGHTAGTTQTATLLSTGTLQVYTTTTNGDLISVTGGTIASSTGSAMNASQTAAGTTNGAALFVVTIKPNSGVTSMTVSLATLATTTGAALVAGTATGVTQGFISVTIATSSVSGVVSTASSAAFYQAAGVNTGGLTTDDTTGTPGTSDWNTKQLANIAAKDAYGVSIGAGVLETASATNGAFVALTAAANTGSPSASTAFLATNLAPDNSELTVSNPTTSPLTTVVTITVGGVVISAKTFTFTGKVAKVTLSAPANGKTGQSTSNTATISFADSAGNAVFLQGTNTPAANFVQDSASFGTVLTSTTLTKAPSSSTVPGVISFGCGPNAGSANLDVKYTNNDGSVVTSNAIKVTCSGAAVSYSAKYDKSSYNLGDIATLTVTFLDSKGNLANDVDAVATAAGTITTAGLGATAVVGPLAADATTNGVLIYKYTVGNSVSSTGTFSNAIDFSTVDARATSVGLSQLGVTASLTVNSSGTSLNDVLKGIVSLIASINKQIAALAKLVTKK